MIPRIIHYTYKDQAVLNRYQSYLEKAQQVNKDWQICLYDDAAARNIVATCFNEYLPMYDAFEHAVQRADVFRIMIVYLQGGFYADMDMDCLKPLDDLCHHQLVLAEEKTLSDADCKQLLHLYPLRIANYMFGSNAHHPFWTDVLQAIHDQHKSRIHSEHDILEQTGPGLLTNLFHEKRKQYSNIHLLENHTHYCPKTCCSTPSCHFGGYAAHWHHGSWRWQQ